MKIKKTILSLVLALATMTICATTAVWAEESNVSAPTAANITRGLVNLPAGTYYCLSATREDSYIKITNDKTGSYDQTVTYNKVYSSEKKNYVTGTGYHTYSMNSSFNFCINSWHLVGSTTNQTDLLIIPTTYSGGEFILVHGEIYARK